MNVIRPAIRRRIHRRAFTRNRWPWAVLIAAAGLLTAAGLPSAAPAAAVPAARAPAPGVTPRSVLIGSDQALSGPAALGFGEIAPASSAFFDYVNARGGVYGRTITYTFLDDANDPATAAADANQLVSGDQVLAYFNGFGNATHSAVVDGLNVRGVPDLFVGSGCECWNQPARHPETFGYETDYVAEGRVLGSYVARAFPTARVGYIWENDPVGCCRQGVQALDSQIPAARVVTRQSYTLADLAAGRLLPQVEAARAAGAQVLVLYTLPVTTALVLLDAARIGYHPTILVASPQSADPATVGGFIERLSGGTAGTALENGLMTEDYLPSATDTANPWITLFRQIHDTYEPQQPFDNMTVFGMAAAYTFARALQAAGPDPTRQSLVAAVDFGAVNFGGPGLAPLDYSPVNHAGYGGEQIGTVENGGIVLSGPVYFTHDTGRIIALRPATPPPPPHHF